jgi:hypothetical protein
VEVFDVPSLVAASVAIHQGHHFVHRRLAVRDLLESLVDQSVHSLFFVAVYIAAKRAFAHTQQPRRFLLSQMTSLPTRICLFESHLPDLL